MDEHFDHLCAKKRSILVKRYYRNPSEYNKETLINQSNECIVRQPKWVFQVHLYMNTEWNIFFQKLLEGSPGNNFTYVATSQPLGNIAIFSVSKIGKIGKIYRVNFQKSLNLFKYRHVIHHFNDIFVQIIDLKVLEIFVAAYSIDFGSKCLRFY